MTWKWSIALYVPHTQEPDIEYHYTRPDGVGYMEELCVDAIAQAAKDYPGKGYELLGTTIHGVIVDPDDLLDAHPDHLNHVCGKKCEALAAKRAKRAEEREAKKAARLASPTPR